MSTYPSPPIAFVDSYDSAINYTAFPHSKQIDGGVQVASVDGMFQVTTQARPLRFIARNTADYVAIRDFFLVLRGKPFTFGGENWTVASKTWTPIGFRVWQLDLSLVQFHG